MHKDKLAHIRERADTGDSYYVLQDRVVLLREVDFLQRQLDAVDNVLLWAGTGEGRVSSIEKLQEKAWLYDELHV